MELKELPGVGEVFGIAEWRPNLRRSFPWPPKGANSRAKTVLSGLAPASIACALGRTMMSCHAASRMASTVMAHGHGDERGWTRCPGRDARPDEDLQEARRIVLCLSRRPFGPKPQQSNNPAARMLGQCPRLIPPGNLPRLP